MSDDTADIQSLTITEAFDLGDRILAERGWGRDKNGGWMRPSDGRPARLSAMPDHKNGDLRRCVQLSITFAAFKGEGRAPANEVLWTQP